MIPKLSLLLHNVVLYSNCNLFPASSSEPPTCLYGNYQKPTYGNYQNSYSYAYQNYNPYNPTLYPNNNIGIIGENGVVVPPTTTGTTGITTPTTEIVTAIRDHK